MTPPQNKHKWDLKATRTTLATNLKAGNTSCSLDRTQCKSRHSYQEPHNLLLFLQVPRLREALSLQGISCFTILAFSGENFKIQRGSVQNLPSPRYLDLFLCLWPFRDTNTFHYHRLFSWQHPPPTTYPVYTTACIPQEATRTARDNACGEAG